jgi:hypothetical protein
VISLVKASEQLPRATGVTCVVRVRNKKVSKYKGHTKVTRGSHVHIIYLCHVFQHRGYEGYLRGQGVGGYRLLDQSVVDADAARCSHATREDVFTLKHGAILAVAL